MLIEKEIKLCIFLTGTIEPKSVPNLKRDNSLEREQDYYNAIKKWQLIGIPIVFCENSNFESGKIDSLFKDRDDCEYIKFKTKISHLGKGNGEAEIFEYAFENSEILRRTSFVCKVTGRYFVKNYANIFNRISNLDFEVCANLTHNLSWADSRLFIFKPIFYFNFLKYSFARLSENNNIYFEHCLAFSIHSTLFKNLKFKQLPILPIYDGYYGTSNTKYKTNFIKVFKYSFYSKLKSYFFNSAI